MSEVSAARSSARVQAAWLFAVALALRLAVVAWAGARFPPADDGSFYHAVAIRIAEGRGYTWAWPDGVVTYAAHYPVGYPALIGAAYALFGAKPVVAMGVNALLGALLVAAVHGIALRGGSRGRALAAGLAVALHPTLILYTAAVMTEAAAAALLVLLAWLALTAGRKSQGLYARIALGLGGAALLFIRSQLLPVLPLLGAVAMGPLSGPWFAEARTRLKGALQVSVVALACCVPWTLRNCAKMDACVFVSANGGWNLLIGTLPEGRGTFAPISGSTVPEACREVFGEAGKDRCFGQAAAQRIRAAPWEWLRLAPAKLGQLFDHGAIAGSYLQTSNPALVSDERRRLISTAETLSSRLLLVAACWGVGAAALGLWGRGLATVAFGFALSPWGSVSQLFLLAALLTSGPSPGRRPFVFLAAGLLLLCVVTHAVFFGAPRYALVWLPWLALCAVMPRLSERTPNHVESFDSGAPGR